jgi:hypothetical protein
MSDEYYYNDQELHHQQQIEQREYEFELLMQSLQKDLDWLKIHPTFNKEKK